MVDPAPLASHEISQIRQGGQVDYIIITNRDHVREADTYKKEFDCQVFVPEKDASEITVQYDKTFADGELLPGGIWAVHLRDQKSPGECALFLQQGDGTFIIGDALIGKPPGTVSLLPVQKYADINKAREGLQRLLKYKFNALLVGDGASILRGAKQVVEQALQ